MYELNLQTVTNLQEIRDPSSDPNYTKMKMTGRSLVNIYGTEF